MFKFLRNNAFQFYKPGQNTTINKQIVQYLENQFVKNQNESGLNLLRAKNNSEILLRVKIIGLNELEIPNQQIQKFNEEAQQNNYINVIECTHFPFFQGKLTKGPGNQKDIDLKQNKTADQIIIVKLSSLQYPLNERTIKEMQFPKFKLFSSIWYLKINLKDVQIQGNNNQYSYISGWLSRSYFDSSKSNIQFLLINKGMAILSKQTEQLLNSPLDVQLTIQEQSLFNWRGDKRLPDVKEFSYKLLNQIADLKQAQRVAKLKQIGPEWSNFKSEFQRYQNINKLMIFKDKLENKIRNYFKR